MICLNNWKKYLNHLKTNNHEPGNIHPSNSWIHTSRLMQMFSLDGKKKPLIYTMH